MIKVELINGPIKFFPLNDIEKDLPVVFHSFWEDTKSRTCTKCGDILEK